MKVKKKEEEEGEGKEEKGRRKGEREEGGEKGGAEGRPGGRTMPGVVMTRPRGHACRGSTTPRMAPRHSAMIMRPWSENIAAGVGLCADGVLAVSPPAAH